MFCMLLQKGGKETERRLRERDRERVKRNKSMTIWIDIKDLIFREWEGERGGEWIRLCGCVCM